MSHRVMPVRADNWTPPDRIYNGILQRAVADATLDERRDGTPELMAGAVMVVVLFVAVAMFTGEPGIAALISAVLAVGIFAITVGRSRPAPGDRHRTLWALGGPGRLPAGYLVSPTAWEAGMSHHVAHLPESQLRAAAEMCHLYPGTVDDLIQFVGHIAIHVPPPLSNDPLELERRTRDLVRVGLPMLREYVKTAPPLPVPAEKSGKKR